jgi:uncharacterized protein with FMN-binding domain
MFPKRGAVALGLTGLALALLLSFKTPSEPVALAGTSGGGLALADQPAATAPASTESGTGTSEATTAPQATAAPATTTSPAATAAPTATPAAAGASGTYTGDAVAIRWGVVQVQVTIEGGRIVDVAAVQLPTGDHHSAMLSQQAEPILRSSALQAQSAAIDLVSGATYTSAAYAQSLQAALDQAGL